MSHNIGDLSLATTLLIKTDRKIHDFLPLDPNLQVKASLFCVVEWSNDLGLDVHETDRETDACTWHGELQNICSTGLSTPFPTFAEILASGGSLLPCTL